MKAEPLLCPGKRSLIGASVLLILHGALELLSILWVFFPGMIQFAFTELGNNWRATMVIGVVSGLLRIGAAVGILKNRFWGWVLGVIMAVITFAMLTFYLPAGAMDAVLAGGTLFLLLLGRYPTANILLDDRSVTGK